jgi:hypothetical protein
VIEIPKYFGWPAVALIGYGVLWWSAQRAAYYPFRYPNGLWQLKDEIGVEDVWIEAADGVRLHAWWAKAEGARLVMLFLHGNAGNITHRAYKIVEMRRSGVSVLALDYRGYGRSEGKPSEAGLFQDGGAAYRHLLATGYEPRQIVLYGESLGTAVAIDVASRFQCAGLALEAPFTSGRELAGRVLPLIGPLIYRSYDSLGKIGRINVPLLFIQGTRDEVVPIEMGKRLFAAAPSPKEFWELPEADHNNVAFVAGPRFAERLREFYTRL